MERLKPDDYLPNSPVEGLRAETAFEIADIVLMWMLKELRENETAAFRSIRMLEDARSEIEGYYWD